MQNAQLESLSPISLHYYCTTGPLLQNEGAILKIKGQFCQWSLPKLSLYDVILTSCGRWVYNRNQMMQSNAIERIKSPVKQEILFAQAETSDKTSTN